MTGPCGGRAEIGIVRDGASMGAQLRVVLDEFRCGRGAASGRRPTRSSAARAAISSRGSGLEVATPDERRDPRFSGGDRRRSVDAHPPQERTARPGLPPLRYGRESVRARLAPSCSPLALAGDRRIARPPQLWWRRGTMSAARCWHRSRTVLSRSQRRRPTESARAGVARATGDSRGFRPRVMERLWPGAGHVRSRAIRASPSCRVTGRATGPLAVPGAWARLNLARSPRAPRDGARVSRRRPLPLILVGDYGVGRDVRGGGPAAALPKAQKTARRRDRYPHDGRFASL